MIQPSWGNLGGLNESLCAESFMDKAQIHTTTLVSRFLSRFRFEKFKSPAPARPVVPDKSLSEVNSSDQQESLFPTLNPSSPGQSRPERSRANRNLCPLEPFSANQCDDPFENFHPPSSTQYSMDPDSQTVAREIFTAGSTYREVPPEEGSSGSMNSSRFGGIHKAGKGEELLTYKRRTRIGGQKRKDPDDRELNSPRTLRALETESIADTFDQPSHLPEKVTSKSLKEGDAFGRPKFLSKFNTWKRIRGPQKAMAPKRTVGQYFLDLGQSDFSYSTCPTCGLFYARGHESDEKIHKTFHRNFTQGIIFKGWQSERVASRLDDKGNRVIIVLAEDTHHQAKVREVAAVMELELGLTPHWLLQSSCKVYLFISSSKKILGCLMAEPIKSAYRIVPPQRESPGEGIEQGMFNTEEEKPSILKNESLCAPYECSSQLDRKESELPTTYSDEIDTREQRSNEGEVCLSPKLGPRSSSDHAVCPANLSSMSVSSVTGDSLESKSKVESALTHVKQEPLSIRDKSKAARITDFFAPKTRAAVRRAVLKSERDGSGSKPDVKGTRVKVEKDEELQGDISVPGQCQQPNLRNSEQGEKAFPSHVSEVAHDPGKPLDLISRRADVQGGNSKEDRKHRTNVMIFGNIKFSREKTSRKRPSKERTQDLGSAILCTTTPVPAVCGVRVIWVSHSDRRKGIASLLLDAMRKTFSLGVVLEPSQFAFSQPTPEGRRFAARYVSKSTVASGV